MAGGGWSCVLLGFVHRGKSAPLVVVVVGVQPVSSLSSHPCLAGGNSRKDGGSPTWASPHLDERVV